MTIERCGYAFGWDCPMRLAQSWGEHCQTYVSNDGGADTDRRVDAGNRTARAYDRHYGCLTTCKGHLALKAKCREMVRG